MSTSPLTPATHNPPNVVSGIVRRFTQILRMFAAAAALMFIGAGRLDWVWAWVYIGVMLAILLANGTLLLRTRAELVAERGNAKVMQKWDKIVSFTLLALTYLALPLLAGLDARFGWTPKLDLTWRAAGIVVLIAGYEIAIRAMLANAYFSTAVRIQSERGHTVCRRGPYRFVRHPGYIGFMLMPVGTALILGSLWAFLLALASAIPIVIRTALEDRMLQAELPGYCEYARDVRYRLVPGIW